ncbi:hypothetical protein Hanom_Chr09g00833001 [Helianthus anomalus]
MTRFHSWIKMATKMKPQVPRYKRFRIWTKVAKLPKPQRPKWQFTLKLKKTNCLLPATTSDQ